MGVHQLFLSLGGHLGNRVEIFAETRRLIGETIGETKTASAVFCTPPWGFKSSRWFWNQVLLVETRLSPGAVLAETRKIEGRFGRVRQPGRYLSRKMDIDLLFYDDWVLEGQELLLPHPLLHLRRFVLAPLAEIAPGLIHPVLGLPVSRLLETCPDPSVVEKIRDPA